MQQGLSNWYRDKFDELSGKPDDDTWRKISGRLKDTPLPPQRGKRRGIVYLLAGLLFLNLSVVVIFFFVQKNGTEDEHRIAQADYNRRSGSAVSSGDPDAGNTRDDRNTSGVQTVNQNNVAESHRDLSGANGEQVIASKGAVNSNSQQHIVKTGLYDADPNTVSVNDENDAAVLSLSAVDKRMNSHLVPADVSDDTSTVNDLKGITDASTDLFLQQESVQRSSSSDETSAAVNADPAVVNSGVKSAPVFYYGPAVKLQNSWLLNDQTYAGFNRHGFDQNHLFLAPVFGLQFGYMFNPKLGIEGHFYFNNKCGQRYSIFSDGVVKNEKMIFYGTSSDLSVKIGIHTGSDHGFYFKGGAQLFFIDRYNWITDKTITSYNDFQYTYPSILLVGEYDFKPFGQWQLMTGVRSNIGLQNIILSGQFLEAGFDRSLLTDLNLYISISRRYIRKARTDQ